MEAIGSYRQSASVKADLGLVVVGRRLSRAARQKATIRHRYRWEPLGESEGLGGLSALEDSCCSRSISVSSGLARVREEAPEPIADGHDSSLFLSFSAEPRWLRAEGCVVLGRVGVWL